MLGLTPQKIGDYGRINYCCCGTPLSAGIHDQLGDLRELARIQLSTVTVPSMQRTARGNKTHENAGGVWWGSAPSLGAIGIE